MNKLNEFEIKDGILTKYLGSAHSIIVPDGVTIIGEQAFEECQNITDVWIPNSVNIFGNRAFYGCSNLKQIKMPIKMSAIGKYAFSECCSLTDIQIPGGISMLAEGIFADCKKLTSVILPDSLVTIGTLAFGLCHNLTAINIPNGVTTIEAVAFLGCRRFTNINIPNGVTSIGKSAFAQCTGLVEISIPGSVTEIGEGVFENCDKMTLFTAQGSYSQQYAERLGINFEIYSDGLNQQLTNCKNVFTLKNCIKIFSKVNDVRINPSCKYIIATVNAYRGFLENDPVTVYNLETGEYCTFDPLIGDEYADLIRFNKTGNRVYISALNNISICTESLNGNLEPIALIEQPMDIDRITTFSAIEDQDKFVICGYKYCYSDYCSQDSLVGVSEWNCSDGITEETVLSSNYDDDGAVYTMDVSPDGRYVAYCERKGNTSIVSLASGKIVQYISAVSFYTSALKFSWDSSFLIICNEEEVRIVDVVDWSCSSIPHGANAIDISYDCRYLILGKASDIIIYDLILKKEIALYRNNLPVKKVELSLDKKHLISKDNDKVMLWPTPFKTADSKFYTA